jgi:hydrogenase nickel incorporation protein HypA/HybF
MHELALAREVLRIVADRAAGRSVRRIVLEIGKLSQAMPDAVRFAFDAVVEGTPLEGAVLEIVETPGRARCRSCAAEFGLERPFGRCGCGSTDLDWIAGDELKVNEMEVA